MALEPIANVAGAAAEPAALKLATVARELRAFDAVSRVKRFETSQEMRFAAWAESRDAGVALVYSDQAKLLVPGERGPVLVAERVRPRQRGARRPRTARAVGWIDGARPIPRRARRDVAGERHRIAEVRYPAAP